MRQARDEAARLLTKKLTDEGRLIEVGWALFELYVVPKTAGEVQRREMRLAYMAGAEHLWSSMMNVLDEGAEPSERDLRRMDLIAKEIEEWRSTLQLRMGREEGTA